MPLPPFSPILTERLIVRPAEERDLADLMAVNGDGAVTEHLPYPTWTSLADGHAWWERMRRLQESGTARQCVVEERFGGRVVGTCLLFRFDEGSARAELGYVLGRTVWGRGYMCEALKAVLAVAFSSLRIRRVEAEVNPQNQPSVRLLERLGFTREGLLRQRWVAKGNTYDVAVYGLLREEFPGTALP